MLRGVRPVEAPPAERHVEGVPGTSSDARLSGRVAVGCSRTVQEYEKSCYPLVTVAAPGPSGLCGVTLHPSMTSQSDRLLRRACSTEGRGRPAGDSPEGRPENALWLAGGSVPTLAL